MIKLDFAEGLFVYFLFWFLTLTILWIREVWRGKVNDWSLSNSRLFHCDNCHYAFLVKDNANITRCPRCNSMCIFRKNRNF